MLFGNGLSALLTLMGISAALVTLFIVGPLAIAGRGLLRGGWPRWLSYFGCLGAGFMLIEVSTLQQFVLLLGHPVYSLTITLFSLLLGTGLGSFLSRAIPSDRLSSRLRLALLAIVLLALVAAVGLPVAIDASIQLPLAVRAAVAIAMLVPAGALMGIALPAGVRLLSQREPDLVPWAWGMNGALSVLGATLAVFIAMNWGFFVTLLAGGNVYLLAWVLVPRD
jgi:predicted membrane-bound spermidine synthase